MTTRLVLYIRKNDPSSQRAREWSEKLQSEFPHVREERYVEEDSAWEEAAAGGLPAAELDGRRLPVPITENELKSALAVARAISDYRRGLHRPVPAESNTGTADRIAQWFSRHWLSVFNAVIGVYVGLAFLAPVLMKAGATVQASWIYSAYSYTCHQLGFRSFYLFGEKPYILRDEFAAYTGIDPNDLLAARDFLGNDRLGYKAALCQRDLGIYTALLLAGIGFHFIRKRIKPLAWWLWILVGIVPMGIDGGSQLLSYLPLGIFPPRESTPLLRVFTGALFGITSVWFAYPYVEESMEIDIGAPSGGGA